MAQAHAVKEATKMDRMAGINALTAISASMGIDQMKSVTAATTGGARTTGQSSYSVVGIVVVTMELVPIPTTIVVLPRVVSGTVMDSMVMLVVIVTLISRPRII